MAARPTLDPLREAAQRLNEAEIERNRLIRALRSKRETLTDLAEAADVSLGTAHKFTRPSTIVSVGYEGRSVDELVDALVEAGVSVLVDVRENAISRKRGLSKRALAEKLQARGIAYVHEPTLGNPRDNRDGFREQRPDSVAAFEAHLVVATGARLLTFVSATGGLAQAGADAATDATLGVLSARCGLNGVEFHDE